MLIDEWIDNKKAANLFGASDLIALPYMKYYEYGTSGVMSIAAHSKRPVLCPDIQPFKDVIDNHNIGQTFKCENIDDLVQTISTIYKNYDIYQPEMFNDYLNTLEDWDDVVSLYFS